jgi:alkylhydroperoxidase/carboxymuconolactone decarboxylase family protein YurZ
MPPEELPEAQRQAKDRMQELRGFWSSMFDEMLFLNPEYVVRYGELSAHPGNVLDRRFKELIHIAIDCTTTHLYHRGTRSHINNAFDHGATLDEILEVVILTSTIGVHSSTAGAGLVREVLYPDHEGDDSPNEAIEERLKYWSADVAALEDLDRTHLEHYADLISVAWETGPLDPVEKHLILLATEITPTRLNEEAARIHLENAHEAGASEAELMAVIQTASVIGVHALDAVTILTEEASKRGLLPDELTDRPDYLTFRDPRYL